jgi:hypothetical protein
VSTLTANLLDLIFIYRAIIIYRFWPHHLDHRHDLSRTYLAIEPFLEHLVVTTFDKLSEPFDNPVVTTFSIYPSVFLSIPRNLPWL